MPVKLFTGLPGAGKTACLVEEIIRLRKDQPDRPIYQRGINGLSSGLAHELTDAELHAWWELSPGAIICIDECQEAGLMPQDKGQPAEWVKRIAKVRHEGMDFLLTTQHPNNMSSFVRRLVDHHVHAVRKFNTQIVSRYMWGRCVETPEKPSTQKGATSTVGTLPKEVFDLYKSASMHTMKKRIPPKVYFLGACVVAFVALMIALPFVFKHLRAQSLPHPKAAEGAGAADTGLRAKDYLAWVKPRVEGIPWTAPAYDGQSVTAKPAVYCIAVEDGGCDCVSEQGTTLTMDKKQCRLIAANGIYNPFLTPSQDDRPVKERTQQARESDAAKRPSTAPDALASPAGDVPALQAGVGPQDYVPPGYGPRNNTYLPGGSGN